MNIDSLCSVPSKENSVRTERPAARKTKIPSRYKESSDSEVESETEESVVEETEDESDETDSSSDDGDKKNFSVETHCYVCKRTTVPKCRVGNKGKKRDNWIACDRCLFWFHDVCVEATDEDLEASEFCCNMCRI